jgi:hypothetical protein
VGAGLDVEQFLINAARSDEIVVPVLRDDPALIHDDDPVRVPDVGQLLRLACWRPSNT